MFASLMQKPINQQRIAMEGAQSLGEVRPSTSLCPC
jgi:hypothetical protein